MLQGRVSLKVQVYDVDGLGVAQLIDTFRVLYEPDAAAPSRDDVATFEQRVEGERTTGAQTRYLAQSPHPLYSDNSPVLTKL